MRGVTAMNSVIKGASYILAHTPDMVMENGTTQTTEKVVNPGSEYLKELPNHIRTYEQALAYLPNRPTSATCIQTSWQNIHSHG